MSLLQQPIERKLSSLLGAEVTFQQFKVSLLKGAIEATGVSVAADEGAEPVLTIGRVRAEISIARALKKEIVIKSLAIDRPMLNVIRRVDGSTNWPRRVPVSELQGHPEVPTKDQDDSGGLVLEIQKLLLVEGEASYRSEAPEDGGYHFTAEAIMADLSQQERTIPFTLIAHSVGRRDRAGELGELKLAGRLSDAPDLGHLSQASMEVEGTLGQALHVRMKSPALARREVEGELRGQVDVAALLALVPPSVATVRKLVASGVSGQATVSIQAQYGPATGLRIPSAHFQLQDVAIGFTPGSVAEHDQP